MLRYTLGVLLLCEAGFFLLPIITALCFDETETLRAFVITAFICVAIALPFVVKKPTNTELFAKEGFVIVSLSWIVLSAFGALPFVISGAVPNYIDAFFEIVSGFTTTGSSIIPSVEDMPKAILIWRSFSNWVGGMGVLVFVMAFLPLSGGQNMHIMRAESPGPEVAKLVPKVKNTAKILYLIYLSLTAIQFLTLLISGMPVFDSLNTAFATAGTGGFGFKNDSFASVTAAQQVIVTVFLLIFSINFNSYYLVLKLKFRDAFNSEVKTFLAIVAVATLIITINISSGFESVWEALRHAAFTVSSIISTCGFSTENFDLWPQLSRIILVLIMFIGACAGSTGGGIKVSRIIILFKGYIRELNTLIHPRQVKKITIDSRPVEHVVVRSVSAYIVSYVLVFAVSLLLVSLDNHSFTTSFTSIASALNNIGPGLEDVGPAANFGFFSPLSKIVLIFDMLAGRLELFPMLILFSPTTWKKY